MCTLDIPLKYANKLYNEFQVRHPNAFYLRYNSKMKGWDGKIKFISKTGQFRIGLLPRVYKECRKLKLKPRIIDNRKPLPKVTKVVDKIGKFQLREEQIQAVQSVVLNKFGTKFPFQIGVLDYTVNAGKCTGKGTLIHTEDGLLPIEQIVSEKGKIIYKGKILTKEGQLVKPKAGVFNKIKVVKITTTQGYTLICGYDNHRLYTYYEGKLQWVYAKNLKKGDPLPISLEYSRSKTNIGKDLSYILGALSGDGHIHRVSDNQINISISGQDIEVAETVKLVLDKICKTPVEIKTHRKFEGFHISKSDTNFTHILQSEYPELINSAHGKYVPDKILRSSYEDMRNYIAGLFDTDGHNSSSHGRRSLSFSTVNYENAKRVQQILLSLGIASCLRPKKTLCNGKRGITYRLTIHSEYYDEFLEIIPLRIKRKCIPSNPKRNNYSNKLPFSDLAKSLYNILSWKEKGEFKDLYSNTLRTQVTHRGRLTLTAFGCLIEFLESKGFKDPKANQLLNLSEHCYWDKVDKVEVIDEYPCYDMEIPKYHNYLSNGFISHNSLIMASLYLTYKRQLKTLILVNDSDWLQQAKTEFKDYLPGEPITFVQGKVPKPWNNFSIGMVQSISKNIKYYQSELSSIDMVLIDEADQAGSKTYQTVITHLLNTRVRVGLSGTIYMSKLAKDKLKNWNLESYLGQTLAKFALVDSIKKGYSTKTIVKCISPRPFYGNDYNDMLFDYDAIYKSVIIENPHGYEMILSRVKYNMKYGRLPLLVVCKFIKHCELVHEYLEKHLPGIKIAHVHVQTPTKQRHQILKDFKDGNIQILVSTTIIARGKNMPLLKCLINAASMDAREKTIQILGRIVRTHASKNKVYLDDLIYPGDYLYRHAKHRKNYYYQQRLKVIFVGPNKIKPHKRS